MSGIFEQTLDGLDLITLVAIAGVYSASAQNTWQVVQRLKIRRRRSISRNAVATGVIIVVLIAAIYVDYFHRTGSPPPQNVYPIAISFPTGINSYAIPSPFFGVGGLGNPGLGSNPDVISALTEAGFGWTRLEASLNLIFPQGANNPQFSNLDYVLQEATKAGIKNIILLIDYTPTWLANQSDYPCRSVSHYPPSNFTEWGELAAEVAKHVQSNFHFNSIYYEIWNEPDASFFLCTPPSVREATYFSIFHYAAEAILSEAYAANIAVGGPVLANPVRDIQMIYDFVHNPQTAPYIGFVSYHQYTISGLPDSWDNENSVYHQMQNSSSGYAAIYEQIAKIVHSGTQPNASSTPIYSYLNSIQIQLVETAAATLQYMPLCSMHYSLLTCWIVYILSLETILSQEGLPTLLSAPQLQAIACSEAGTQLWIAPFLNHHLPCLTPRSIPIF